MGSPSGPSSRVLSFGAASFGSSLAGVSIGAWLAGVSIGASWVLYFGAALFGPWLARGAGRRLAAVMSSCVHREECLSAGGELPCLRVDRRST